jgi:hypothetical protein
MIRHHARLFLLALAPLPLGSAQVVTPPAASATRLQKALAENEPGRALAAIEACGRIAHDDVVKQLAKGLQHKEPAVQRATLLALRHNPQPAALAALLTAAGNEKLLADDETAVAYYLALGQKRDVNALPVLTKGLHVERGSEVVAARILAIGRIRSPRSVEALVQLIKSGGNGRRGGAGNNPHMRELRMALAALTGEDHGQDETAWIQWWAAHHERYRLPAEDCLLPKALRRTWETTWRDPQDQPPKQADGTEPHGETSSARDT